MRASRPWGECTEIGSHRSTWERSIEVFQPGCHFLRVSRVLPVNHKPSCQLVCAPWLNLPIRLQPWSGSSGAIHRYACKGNDGFPDLDALQETLFNREGKQGLDPYTFPLWNASWTRQGWWGAVFYKLPLLDLGKAGVIVTGKWAVNRNTGHVVGGVPKLLKIWLSLTFPLRACQVAFLYVDADDVYRIIVLSIPEAALALFYAGLLDVIGESGWFSFQPFLSFAMAQADWFVPTISSPMILQALWSIWWASTVLERKLVN